MAYNFKIVITDLDGTLLTNDHKISAEDLETLNILGNKEIVRVIATGRSLFSVNKVLPVNFPVDFIVFSSGAGVYDWKEKKIIKSTTVVKDIADRAVKILTDNDADFMVHNPIPDNHRFLFRSTGRDNPDFLRRLEVYKDYATPLKKNIISEDASQIITIFPPGETEKFSRLLFKFNFMKTVRTTSPFDGESLWLELFPMDVSKAEASKWLCEQLDIDPAKSLGIGNDYNDIDLLEWAGLSFVVDGAPEELKDIFRITSGNDKSGFSKAVRAVIDFSE